MVKVIIDWVADYNFLATLAGGAEMSDRKAYIYGLKKDHELSLIVPENANQWTTESAELIIVSNAARYGFQWLFKKIATKPYIMYLHDYWPLCDYRLFYPMQEKCKKCKNLEQVKQVLLNSMLNIFLSPLHLESWCFVIPELKDHPHHIHPSPVDLEMFKPMKEIKRNPKAGLVINAAAFKGAKNTVEYCKNHPEITFTFVGSPVEKIRLPSNCAHIGFVSPMKMPGMFAQANYYVELPDTPQPFNRTVLEARLMEVPHLILNKNIGAASYPWFKKDLTIVRKNIEEAVPKWWDKVLGAMK